MSTVPEIESALRQLPLQEARTVAAWLQEYRDKQWDRQIEADVAAGKLDRLADQARACHRAGQVKPLNEIIGRFA